MQIDTSTTFGARVAQRLQQEIVIWLTTVRPNGLPEPSPVWFLWDGETALIYSRPNNQKLRNIAANSQVALNFDGNGQGGDIIVLTGQAELAPEAPPANQVPAYVAKYAAPIQRIGMTPDSFAAAYSVALRVRPTKLRGH
jgi:PPOX class probable F420-dependent enzyme